MKTEPPIAMRNTRTRFRSGLAAALAAALALLGLGGAPLPGAAQVEEVPAGAEESRSESVYDVLFSAALIPSQGLALVSIRVSQDEYLARRLEFPNEADRFFRFEGDGTVKVDERSVTWELPEAGGELRYSVRVDHLRESAEYDARLSRDWALLRGSDLFPPGVTRVRKGSRSKSTLQIKIPTSWKALVPYPSAGDSVYDVDDPDSLYDRPAGWMLFGESLRRRSARIAGMRVRIGGPKGHGVRGRDLMALLRWTLPSLKKAVGELPPSLTIIAAGDPMWRGGLSGPDSLYLHADRPLIQPDGTSPVLHELIHVVTGARADAGADWIVEGLAEYYSLELLRRSGTVSKRDWKRTVAKLEKHAAPLAALGKGEADFAATARGVLVMRELDGEIRDRTDGGRSLDDVLRILTAHQGSVDAQVFRAALRQAGGEDVASLLPPTPTS